MFVVVLWESNHPQDVSYYLGIIRLRKCVFVAQCLWECNYLWYDYVSEGADLLPLTITDPHYCLRTQLSTTRYNNV